MPSGAEVCAETPHVFTGRMCAASRWEESQRPDSLFVDPLAAKLAGREGMASPMGSWIMVPRTRFGDDYLRDRYVNHGCRQLVMLGAGMDARAYRMPDLPELHIYEIDKQDNFNVKEPLLKDEPLTVASRHPVAAEFEGNDGQWARDLIASGFDPERPTVWLLEGLVMYLNIPDTIELFKEIGQLSSKGSVVFHDACSARYMSAGIVVGGAKFIGGSDEYGRLWATHGGFNRSFVHDFKSVRVDRRQRRVVVDERQGEATPQSIRGRDVVLFVQAEKA